MKNAFDVPVQPVVTAGAYAANDVVGGLLTFPIGSGDDRIPILDSVIVTIKAAITSTLTLYLFNAAPAVIADNAAYTIGTVADVHKFIGSFTFGTVVDHGTPNSYMTADLDLPVRPIDGMNIYGYLADGTGFTPTSTSDVQIRMRGHY